MRAYGEQWLGECERSELSERVGPDALAVA